MRVSGRGVGRVSMAALIALRPGLRTRLRYTTRIHRGRAGERKSFSEHDYIALIDSVHQQLSVPLVLVWDRLKSLQYCAPTLNGFIAETGLHLEPP